MLDLGWLECPECGLEVGAAGVEGHAVAAHTGSRGAWACGDCRQSSFTTADVALAHCFAKAHDPARLSFALHPDLLPLLARFVLPDAPALPKAQPAATPANASARLPAKPATVSVAQSLFGSLQRAGASVGSGRSFRKSPHPVLKRPLPPAAEARSAKASRSQSPPPTEPRSQTEEEEEVECETLVDEDDEEEAELVAEPQTVAAPSPRHSARLSAKAQPAGGDRAVARPDSPSADQSMAVTEEEADQPTGHPSPKRERSEARLGSEQEADEEEGDSNLCRHCNRMIRKNGLSEQMQHTVCCHDLKPYVCSDCGLRANNSSKLRNNHCRREHGAERASVLLVPELGELEGRARSAFAVCFPSQAKLLDAWQGFKAPYAKDGPPGGNTSLGLRGGGEPTVLVEDVGAGLAAEKVRAVPEGTEEEEAEEEGEEEDESSHSASSGPPKAPMKCTQCGRGLKDQGPSSVARHVQFCEDIKPYTCSGCPRVRFGTKGDANRHLEREHRGEQAAILLPPPDDLQRMTAQVRIRLRKLFPGHDALADQWRGFPPV